MPPQDSNSNIKPNFKPCHFKCLPSMGAKFPWLHGTHSVRVYLHSILNRVHQRALSQLPNWWVNMKKPVGSSKQEAILLTKTYEVLNAVNIFKNMLKMNTNSQKAKLIHLPWLKLRITSECFLFFLTSVTLKEVASLLQPNALTTIKWRVKLITH